MGKEGKTRENEGGHKCNLKRVVAIDLAADEEVARRQVAVYNAEGGEVLHATGGTLAKGQQLIVA